MSDERTIDSCFEPQTPAANRPPTSLTSTMTIEEAVRTAIDENPHVVNRYHQGMPQAAGALIGQVMKALLGRVQASDVREEILRQLNS